MEENKQVYAGTIFYNDPPEIFEKCLQSLIRANIRPICIDGRFQDFPKLEHEHEQNYSTNGCLEIAKKYAWKLIEAPCENWVDQTEKRNRYLEECPVNHYLLYIDADEVLQPFTVDLGSLTEDLYRVMKWNYETETQYAAMSSILLYKVYPDLRYIYSHSRLYRKNQHSPNDLMSGCLCTAHSPLNIAKPLLGLTLEHYKYLRDLDRKKQKTKYYTERNERQYID